MSVENDIAQWQKLAKMDLATAHHMFGTYRPIPIEIVCFHSQQAGEKNVEMFFGFLRKLNLRGRTIYKPFWKCA